MAVQTKPATAAKSNGDNRLPSVFESNPFLKDIGGGYLGIIDKVQEFNDMYVVDKPADGAPTSRTMFTKAKEARKEQDDNQLEELMSEWDAIWSQMAEKRQEIASYMADKLGVTLTPEAPEVPEEDKDALKEERKRGVEMARAMKQVSTYSNDKALNEAIEKFLSENELPNVGRKDSWSATAQTAGTPKYRVDVTVLDSEGNVVVDKARGFSKAVAEITKQKLYSDKNQVPGADRFREAWEAAGQKDTEFTDPDNGLTFRLTAR